MGPSRLTLCLLVLTVVESTWARAFREIPGANVARRHWRKIGAGDEPIGSAAIGDRGDEFYRDIVRRYLEARASESLRNEASGIGRKSRSLAGSEENRGIPYSARRWQKMLDKAIYKIIMGDLSTADILLLKSLNYNLEEVLAIRERELAKKIGVSERTIGKIGAIGREPIDGESSTASYGSNYLEDKAEHLSNIEDGHSGVTISSAGEKNGRVEKIDSIGRDAIDGESSTVSYGSNYLEDKAEHLSNNEDGRSGVTISSAGKKNGRVEKIGEDFDFEAYNRQAVYDYENMANNMSQQSELDLVPQIVESDDDLRRNFDRAMESHVVFKIRYDDSEFDSRSDERSRQLSRERALGSVRGHDIDFPGKLRGGSSAGVTERSVTSSARIAQSASNAAVENQRNDTFLESAVDMRYSIPLLYRLSNLVGHTEGVEETTIGGDFVVDDRNDSSRSMESAPETVNASESAERKENRSANNNDFSNDMKRMNVYEGLEWVEDDVYRVIPDAADSLDYDANAIYLDKVPIEDDDGNETRGIGVDSRIDDDDRNDTSNYQNEDSDDSVQQQTSSSNSSARNQSNADLSAYQQLAIAHRRDSNLTSTFDSQGQKAIEDIKLKVLAMTGRFNLSSSSNQVQRERLTLFSPICQAPRNTDPEAWSDPFSMNMYFQLNLTSGDHVVAAKLRIYKLPQNNVTLPSSAAGEEEEEEEKKIRISVYFYTKSLKKHRSKKRLMDSVVTALTTEGNHLALDVRQAIRFWRQNLRNSHGSSNNHGLVIQVEDQDGRPLKPSQYIERDTCHDTERNEDDKAYQRVPALFIQACSRYVRVVNGEAVVYVNCSKSSRNGRH